MENYIIANKTDVGRARQVNEDSMVTFESPNGRVIAVCDGMGGQAAGDVASRLACDIIRDILENNTFGSPAEAITRAMTAANQGILHRVSQNPELEGMGSTCVMLIIKDGLVYYGWVGDSRIYYICNHTIRQISKDQSYVQSLVDSGEITAEEAEHHPQKNEITNALGLQGMTPPLLCQSPIRPEAGSVFLLCSDGLTGMVDNARIERVISKGDLSLQERADQLVMLANQQGGLDNITLQLVEFKGGNQSQASQMEESTAYDEDTSNKSQMIKIIGGALLVIALAIGAYFLFFKDNSPKQQDKPAIESETKSTIEKEKKEVKKEITKEVNQQSTDDKGTTEGSGDTNKGGSNRNPKTQIKQNAAKELANKPTTPQKTEEQPTENKPGENTTPQGDEVNKRDLIDK